MTPRLVGLVLVLVVAGIACGGESDAPTGPPDTTVASLEIVAPPSLIVNESALLTVTARNAGGVVVPTPSQLEWTSSDHAIAHVGNGAQAGVVKALRRGTVAISANAGSVDASVSLNVKARVVIIRAPFPLSTEETVAIGDTLQFTAFFVDVDGQTIDEIPSVTWASRNTHVASVSSAGLVIALRTGQATITATSSDGTGTMLVRVTDFIAGLPANVRLAHVAGGYGSLTFVPSQGASVTLNFGESVEVPIVSGKFRIHVEGLPQPADREWLIRGGEHFEVFGTSNAGLTGWWINDASVPADSGLVRFLQGTGPPNFAGVVLLGAPGATAPASRLIHCYFDPSEFTDYLRLPAGELDVIMGDKGLYFYLDDPTAIRARGRITVAPGRAVTYVLTGESPQTMRLLAFLDF